MSETFGSMVKKYRELRGLVQEELAHKARVSLGFISKLERWEARSRNPTLNKMTAIAKVLGVSLKILIPDDEVNAEGHTIEVFADIDPESRLPAEEKRLLKEWREADEIAKGYAQTILKKGKKEKPPALKEQKPKSFYDEAKDQTPKKKGHGR